MSALFSSDFVKQTKNDMSGIKDLHSLLFWLDNTKGAAMRKALHHSRPVTREKKYLLKELEREGFFNLPIQQVPKFEKKAPNH